MYTYITKYATNHGLRKFSCNLSQTVIKCCNTTFTIFTTQHSIERAHRINWNWINASASLGCLSENSLRPAVESHLTKRRCLTSADERSVTGDPRSRKVLPRVKTRVSLLCIIALTHTHPFALLRGKPSRRACISQIGTSPTQINQLRDLMNAHIDLTWFIVIIKHISRGEKRLFANLSSSRWNSPRSDYFWEGNKCALNRPPQRVQFCWEIVHAPVK
jgi:hypothetical protein